MIYHELSSSSTYNLESDVNGVLALCKWPLISSAIPEWILKPYLPSSTILISQSKGIHTI